MFSKAFFRNVTIFSLIIGGALLALFFFEKHQQINVPDSSTNLESYIETSGTGR